MSSDSDNHEALSAERDRISRVLARIAHGDYAGDVTHADIADLRKEFDCINALLGPVENARAR